MARQNRRVLDLLGNLEHFFQVAKFNQAPISFDFQIFYLGQRLERLNAAGGGARDQVRDAQLREFFGEHLGLLPARIAQWAQQIVVVPFASLSRFGVSNQVKSHNEKLLICGHLDSKTDVLGREFRQN